MSKPNPAEVKKILDEAIKQRAKNSGAARAKLDEAHDAGALKTEHAEAYRKLTRDLR